MEVVDIDFITVILAALVSMGVQAIWYSSLLFGEVWKQEHQVQTRSKRRSGWNWAFVALLSWISAFFLALLLAFLGATSTLDGIYVAIGLWLGFVVPVLLYPVIWVKPSWKLFGIDSLFWLINFISMGAILAA